MSECARFAHVYIHPLARTSSLNPASGFKWPLESFKSVSMAPSTALPRVANRSSFKKFKTRSRDGELHGTASPRTPLP